MGKNVISLDILTHVKGAIEISQLSTNMKSLKDIVGELNTDIKKTSDLFSKSIATVSQTIVTIQGLSNILGQFSQQYVSFETAMRSANTMAHKDAEGFKEMTDQINELSKRIPIAREQLAAGLYQTISNGVEEPQWLDFLEQSAKAAYGSGADLEGVVNVTSAIIKNYGKSWEDARSIQDMIQKTAELGVTSFGALQQALPRVTANAATLGVSIEELMGTFATLTNISGNTAEVSTQLAAIFTALIKPSKEASEMAKAMGIQFDAAAIKAAGGFQQFLSNFSQQVEQYAASTGMLSEEIMGKFFGSAESFRALIPLTGNLATSFQEKCAAMSEAAGATEFAFGEAFNTTEAKTQLAKNAMSGFLDTVGKIAAVIQPYMQWVAVLGLAISGVKMLYTSLLLLKGIMVALTSAISSGITRWFAYCDRLMATTTLAQQATAAARGLSLVLKAIPIAMITIGLIDLGKALFGSSEAEDVAAQKAKELAEEQSRLNKEYQDWKYSLTDVSQSVADIAAKEITELERLYRVAKDDTRSRNERSDAIKEMKRQWPDYFNQISSERIEVDKLTQSYTNAKNAILDMASVKAIENKLVANAGERLTLEQNLNDNNNDVAFWQNALDKIQRYKNNRAVGDPTISEEKLRYFYDGLSVIEDGAGEKSLADYLMDGLIPLVADGGNPNMLYYNVFDIVGRLQRNLSLKNDDKKLTEKRLSDLQSSDDYLVGQQEKISARLKGKFNNTKPEPPKSPEPSKSDPIDYEAQRRAAAEKIDVDEVMKRNFEVKADYTKALNDLLLKQDYVNSQEYDVIEKNIKALEEKRDALFGAAKAEEYTSRSIKDLNTISDLNKEIAYQQNLITDSAGADIPAIQRTINLLKEKRSRLEAIAALTTEADEVKAIDNANPKYRKNKIRSLGVSGISEKIENLEMKLIAPDSNLTSDQRKQIESLIDTYKRWRKEATDTFSTVHDGWGSIKSVYSGIESATEKFKEHGTAWEKVSSAIDASFAIYEGITRVIALVTALLPVSKAKIQSEQEEANAVNATTMALVQKYTALALVSIANATAGAAAEGKAGSELLDANNTMLAAGANIFKAHSWLPWVGVALGAAGVAMMIATMAGMPKFANGGIVSGPTVGLIGEYAGASNNPEVVAPLDKLRSMLNEGRAEAAPGRVEFEIRGDRLYGLLRRHERMLDRT